jgi:hypothetical protein
MKPCARSLNDLTAPISDAKDSISSDKDTMVTRLGTFYCIKQGAGLKDH